jgi:hypothetical protein
MYRNMMLEGLRSSNNALAGGYQNAPIPRPGQPTNYQIPSTGLAEQFSPQAGNYINQDLSAFNAQQQIPGQSGLMPGAAAGMWNGRPLPQQQPTSTNVSIPGYGNVPVNHNSAGLSAGSMNGPMQPSGSGMERTLGVGLNRLIPGLLSEHANETMTSDQWRGLLPAGQSQQGQLARGPGFSGGAYGNQAAQMAGVMPARNPNGLLGGKRGGGFRPGGK